jgi:hypothetical protein
MEGEIKVVHNERKVPMEETPNHRRSLIGGKFEERNHDLECLSRPEEGNNYQL